MQNNNTFFKYMSIFISVLLFILVLVLAASFAFSEDKSAIGLGRFFLKNNEKPIFLAEGQSLEKTNTTYNLPEDLPVVIKKDDGDISIFGSFKGEEKNLNTAAITIEEGYKGNIFLGEKENKLDIIFNNPNLPVIEIKGNKNNEQPSTIVSFFGYGSIFHTGNYNSPVVLLEAGAAVIFNGCQLNIYGGREEIVIGENPGNDSGSISILKKSEENKLLIQGGHIGAGSGSYYSGRIFSNSGTESLNVNTIGGDKKNPLEVGATVVMLPSKIKSTNEVNFINIKNYFILDRSENIFIDNKEITKFKIDNNGNNNLIPLLDISNQTMPLLAEIELLFLDNDSWVLTNLEINPNTSYCLALSEGQFSLLPSEGAKQIFQKESIKDINIDLKELVISLKPLEYISMISLKNESKVLKSGYDRETAISCGTVLNISNPPKEGSNQNEKLEKIYVIPDNLNFTVVDLNGNYIGSKDENTFSLDIGQSTDIIVKLLPGLPKGIYETEITVNEATVGANKPSSYKIVQTVEAGPSKIIFNTDGGSEVAEYSALEGEEVDLKKYLIGGENVPKKEGYIFTGWFFNNKLLEEDNFILPMGESILSAKWVAVKEKIYFQQNPPVKVYLSESKIEDIVNQIDTIVYIDGAGEKSEKVEIRYDIDETLLSIRGVHEIPIFAKIEGMESEILLDQPIWLYVINKPKIELSQRVVFDPFEKVSETGSEWDIKGENEVVNHTLKTILKENVVVLFNKKNLDTSLPGDYKVEFSMEYTDINEEKNTLIEYSYGWVIGRKISDIDKKNISNSKITVIEPDVTATGEDKTDGGQKSIVKRDSYNMASINNDDTILDKNPLVIKFLEVTQDITEREIIGWSIVVVILLTAIFIIKILLNLLKKI